jgi:AraC-like DNA-binding protein
VTKQPKLLSIGAGVAALASIIGVTSVAAQQGGSTPATSATAVTANVAADPAASHEAFLQSLAANLNIDVATLTEALKQTNLDQVAQLLSDGTITQAQADEMTTRINDGQFGFGGFGGGPRGIDGGPGHGPAGAGFVDPDGEAMATFLGTDTATLETEVHADGATLATVASAHGKSRDELKAFLTTQISASLTQAVTDGKLTEAEAETKLAEAVANLDARIDSAHPEGGRGPRGAAPATPGSSSSSSSSDTSGA